MEEEKDFYEVSIEAIKDMKRRKNIKELIKENLKRGAVRFNALISTLNEEVEKWQKIDSSRGKKKKKEE